MNSGFVFEPKDVMIQVEGLVISSEQRDQLTKRAISFKRQADVISYAPRRFQFKEFD